MNLLIPVLVHLMDSKPLKQCETTLKFCDNFSYCFFSYEGQTLFVTQFPYRIMRRHHRDKGPTFKCVHDFLLRIVEDLFEAITCFEKVLYPY